MSWFLKHKSYELLTVVLSGWTELWIMNGQRMH